MRSKPAKKLEDLCKETGVRREIFLQFVQKEWIHSPAEAEKDEWFEEDARRAHLILELQQDFGVNDEAVPLILHLVDQLNAMQRVLGHLNLESVAEISLEHLKKSPGHSIRDQ